jgi:hypothetical protein
MSKRYASGFAEGAPVGERRLFRDSYPLQR